MTHRVFVIGGANIDIIGTPDAPLSLRDSNIGAVTIAPGGVGRNMAENLAQLGFEVQLLTALGDDMLSAAMEDSCRRNNIALGYAVCGKGYASPVYLCLNEYSCDMFAALNDTAACALLTPERLPMDIINRHDACVIDTNIPEETALHIAQNARIPVFADPVSLHKADRLARALPYLFCVKPNLMEAQYLTGETDALSAARALVKLGVKWACVTDGLNGSAYASTDMEGVCGIVPVAQKHKGNTTGCGDSFAAALCAGYLRGLNLKQSVAFASKVAALTAQSDSAVNPKLSEMIFAPYNA